MLRKERYGKGNREKRHKKEVILAGGYKRVKKKEVKGKKCVGK